MTKEEQKQFLEEMVRYSSKLAPEATQETKFNSEFNWYYDRVLATTTILYCKENEQDSTFQLLVTKEARSITPMQEGIAVKVKLGKTGKLNYYEEVFRTWKMPADSLLKRGKFLFKTMVNGGDLSLYHSKYQRDKFIEFPDDRFVFDVNARRWTDKELDSLKLE